VKNFTRLLFCGRLLLCLSCEEEFVFTCMVNTRAVWFSELTVAVCEQASSRTRRTTTTRKKLQGRVECGARGAEKEEDSEEETRFRETVVWR